MHLSKSMLISLRISPYLQRGKDRQTQRQYEKHKIRPPQATSQQEGYFSEFKNNNGNEVNTKKGRVNIGNSKPSCLTKQRKKKLQRSPFMYICLQERFNLYSRRRRTKASPSQPRQKTERKCQKMRKKQSLSSSFVVFLVQVLQLQRRAFQVKKWLLLLNPVENLIPQLVSLQHVSKGYIM